MSEQPFAGIGRLEPLIDKCVHCGFCLPTCPSYLLLNQEMDSPRGRIYLMKAGVEGRATLGAGFAQHFDSCLGCMACETACPSGVRYAPLLEETRAAIEHHHTRPASDRAFRSLIFHVLPHASRLRLLALPMGLARWLRRVPAVLNLLPARVRNLIALAPDGSLADAWRRLPERTPAAGPVRLKVALLTGCVQQVFFNRVNEATVRVLAAEGCEVMAPGAQGCCGALALHSGRDAEARNSARALISVLEPLGADQIVVNAAGCGSTMKMYGELLRDDAAWAERARIFSSKVRDVTETIASLEPPRATRHPVAKRVAYHDACHLAHAQGIRNEPRALLASIPDLTIVPIAENEICCGSAGIFNLVEPEMAATLGRRKAGHIADTRADLVATSNPGCVLQLQSAMRTRAENTPVLHIMEILDASIAGTQI